MIIVEPFKENREINETNVVEIPPETLRQYVKEVEKQNEEMREFLKDILRNVYSNVGYDFEINPRKTYDVVIFGHSLKNIFGSNWRENIFGNNDKTEVVNNDNT